VEVTKEITPLEKSNVKLSITIPAEQVQSQYNEIIKKYAKNMQLPGFRKGKVPQNVLERKYGDVLKKEAMGKITEETISNIFKDENISMYEKPLPYSQPQLMNEPVFEFGNDLNFTFMYDVMPKVIIKQWKGLSVEVPYSEIGDEDISVELEAIRNRNGFVLDRDENALAQKGDVITVSYFEITEDGEELPNTRRDGFTFTLGSGYNIYEFDDDIAEMKKGETKEITKTYPEDSNKEKKPLAGKTVTLRITVDAIKEKKLPDLDDDFAQDVDEKYQTLDDLKNNIREKLDKELTNRIKELSIENLVNAIIDNSPVILPESMVNTELNGSLRNYLMKMGIDKDSSLHMVTQPNESLNAVKEKWRPEIEKSLQGNLIVETLIKEQGIEALDEEIENELELIASETGKPLEEVRSNYSDETTMELLKDHIKKKKAYSMLLAENTIIQGQRKNFVDLMEDNE